MKTIKKDLSVFKAVVLSYKLECIVIAVVMMIGLLCFQYVDGITLTAWSVEFWDALFDGDIKNFYNVFLENTRSVPYIHENDIDGFRILIGIPWAIWNLPLWLTHIDRNTNVLTMPCLVWSKMFLMVCSVWAGVQCYHLVYNITEDEKQAGLAAVFFWGSGTVALSIGYAMQDEIVYILTFLIALRCNFSGRYKTSLIWLGATVTLAPFMLIVVMPVLLFEYKNLIKVFIFSFFFITPFVISSKVFSAIYHIPSAFNGDFFRWFFYETIFKSGYGDTSIFAAIVLIVFAVSYFLKYNNEKDRKYAMLYFLSALIVSMCVFSRLTGYRYFFHVPFLVICILIATEKDASRIRIGLILFCVLEFLQMMAILFYKDTYMMLPLYVAEWIKKLPGAKINGLFMERIEVFFPEMSGFSILLAGLIFGMMILLLWFIRASPSDYWLPVMFPIRVISIVYSLIPLVFFTVFFVTIFHVGLYNISIEKDDVLAPAIDENISIDQYYFPHEDEYIRQVQVRTVTWDRKYPKDIILNLDVIEKETGEIVGNSQVLANDMPNNNFCDFNVSGIKLFSGNWYIFRFSALGKIDNPEQAIYLLHSDEGTATEADHYTAVHNKIDGTSTVMNYDIVTKIAWWN